MPSVQKSSRNPRSYSYPPCLDSIESSRHSSSKKSLPDIDEEPFAHFLTPVAEEDDPFGCLTMNAGIVAFESPRTLKSKKFSSNAADKWTRYVRSHHAHLHSRFHAPPPPPVEEDSEDEESFMQLEDDRLSFVPHTIVAQTSPKLIDDYQSTRGRAQEVVSRKARNGRRQEYSRTLSGHRHSWREPSPDLFTVDESEEDEFVQTRRTKSKKAREERRKLSTSRGRGDVMERSRL